MSSQQAKCIIILSGKSSGSSALQRFLSLFPQVQHIQKTRHFEYETLYWTKAASILGLPQLKMMDSEVPMPKEKARKDLVNLLSDNLNSYKLPEDDNELIFGGWRLLCHHYSPVFVEKSPHHLYQWSALELIIECMDRLQEIDFLVVGLVRNPMAVLYSSWYRMGSRPEKNQYEWLQAYTNLLKFRDLLRDKCLIIRYEDMVRDQSCLNGLLEFIGIRSGEKPESYFHAESIEKWRANRIYGFRLSEEVLEHANRLGYSNDDMKNEDHILWPVYRDTPKSLRRSLKAIEGIFRTV